MAETPTRCCRQCGHEFALTAEHWYRLGANGWQKECKGCSAARLRALKDSQRARARAARAATATAQPAKPQRGWIPNPAGVGLSRAVARAPVALAPGLKAPPATLKEAVQKAAAPHLDEIATQIGQAALQGEPKALNWISNQLGDDAASEDRLSRTLRELGAARLADLQAPPDPDASATGEAERG